MSLSFHELSEASPVDYTRYMEAAKLAVELDITEPLEIMASHILGENWLKDFAYDIIELAVVSRSDKVYDFLITRMADYILYNIHPNQEGNRLLHLAGKLAPQEKLDKYPDAASQMQMEMQWFKKVGKLDPCEFKEAENKNGETPIMVFRKEHAELLDEGAKWMRRTANQHMMLAVVVVAICFRATNILYNGNRGRVLFSEDKSYDLFLSLHGFIMLASTSSLVLFDSIISSGYRYDEYLYKLHLKLRCGRFLLFLSAALMVLAFGPLYILRFVMK